jgi:hypothetical protein
MRPLANLFVLAVRQALRHRTRSILTVLGVGVGMFLFSSVETMRSPCGKPRNRPLRTPPWWSTGRTVSVHRRPAFPNTT